MLTRLIDRLTPTRHGRDRLSGSRCDPMGAKEEARFPAFRRALERYPSLAPKDASPSAFLAWRLSIGAPQAGREDLCSEYADICDLTGREPVAMFEAQLAKVLANSAAAPVATVAIPVATKPVATLPWKQLPPGPYATPSAPGKHSTGAARLAAERFLDWMLAAGHTGNHSSAEMTALYRAFQAANPSETTKENILREHLGQLQPWVSKVQSYKRIKGQRVRPVVWEISNALALRRAA
jgi:hypothetical protein